jgi:hypothetical protein
MGVLILIWSGHQVFITKWDLIAGGVIDVAVFGSVGWWLRKRKVARQR